MTFTLQDLQHTLKNNQDIFKKAIISNIEDNGDYILKTENGSLLTFSSTWDEEEEDKIVDVNDIDEILELGYSNLISIIKKLNIFKPLPKITSKEDICERMVEFAKDVVSCQFDSNDYEVRLTDGDGGEDSYYIVCFIEKESFQKQKNYINDKKTTFKVYSDFGVIFELSSFPKGYLNLNGSYFYKDIGTDEEMLRGVFLSYYYFHNVDFKF